MNGTGFKTAIDVKSSEKKSYTFDDYSVGDTRTASAIKHIHTHTEHISESHTQRHENLANVETV